MLQEENRMEKRVLTAAHLEKFYTHLICEEKSPVTIRKYLRDVRCFMSFVSDRPVTKEVTLAYKNDLQTNGYAVRSVNSMLAALNGFLKFLGWNDCTVKNLRCQRKVYCPEEKELTKGEYLRLLEASRGQPQLNLVLQTICSTGIRVSELKYFTIEAIRRGEVAVRCKGKNRTILVPDKLKKMLLNYAKNKGITTGAIFVTRNGNPLDRSNIWFRMKQLCAAAGVISSKVFPHNLRKLFARTFYAIDKDIAKLADILGHNSIETTRIYIMSTGVEHRRKIERLGLVIQV